MGIILIVLMAIVVILVVISAWINRHPERDLAQSIAGRNWVGNAQMVRDDYLLLELAARTCCQIGFSNDHPDFGLVKTIKKPMTVRFRFEPKPIEGIPKDDEVRFLRLEHVGWEEEE